MFNLFKESPVAHRVGQVVQVVDGGCIGIVGGILWHYPSVGTRKVTVHPANVLNG